MIIKLKSADFRGETLILSESWIGCTAWVIRRNEVAGGIMQSTETLCALLRPQNVHEMRDAEITGLIPAATDRPVTYLRTNVLIGSSVSSIARLFASVDGQVASVNERIAQMLDLYVLYGTVPVGLPAPVAVKPVDDRSALQCRSVLVATIGGADTGEAYALVMPMLLNRVQVNELELCARTAPRTYAGGSPADVASCVENGTDL